jgi:EAL domain-containing protein (putative c-di-GMP-specific phosphodiesterase class I)
MFLLTICTLLSISLACLRFGLSARWKRSSCFECGSHTLSRKKRTRTDRLLGKMLILPLERYRCMYYNCKWEGVLIYTPKISALEKTPAAQPTQPHNIDVRPSLEDNASINTPEWFASKQNLASAFERDEFTLYYQPSINLETKNIDGVSALLRWQHPERGIIYPTALIPVADDHDFIFLLGQWIFLKACFQLQNWHKQGLYPLRVSVNLSVRQFYEPDLTKTLLEILTETGIKPKSLEIEVSEKTIIQNLELAGSILTELQSIGVWVTVDNLGLGNMPHRHLRRLALDTLKIDQSLIHNLKLEPSNIELIRSYVQLGQSLNLEVIAEGVETYEEIHTLRSLGCEKAQGYLLDRPLSAEDATDVLQSNWLDRKERAESASKGLMQAEPS